MTQEYSLVLSNELLKLYYNFTSGEDVDKPLLTKLLRYYHENHLSCVEQLNDIENKNDALKTQLAGSGYIHFEDLYKKTKYKIILNTKESRFPYVNINNDQVEKNFSLTFKKNENRDKAIYLLKSLCEDAIQIWIYDKYLTTNDYKNLIKFLPKKRLKINFCNNFLEELKKELKKEYSDWYMPTLNKNIYDNLHDRYLRIEDKNKSKIELILSSGFQYLFDTNKDISILIREIS
jgi:hypothetical protein